MGNFARRDLPWADMPFILALSRARSFADAAKELNVDRTTVSRRLDRLETQLNNKIFEREAGEFTLSAEGRRIVAIAERAEQELSQLQPDNENRRTKYGKVRISLSENVLTAFASEFCTLIDELPEIFLELTTSDKLVDLIKYEADIVLRIGRTPSPRLHTVDLGPMQFAIYARKDEAMPIESFWARAGETQLPKTVVEENPEAQILAAIDGVLPTRELLVAGGGAAMLPCVLGDKDGRLIRRADELSHGRFRLFMGCLPEQKNLHRVRLVMKHLSKLISDAL